MEPKSHPATPTPIASTAIPVPLPLATVARYHAFTVGEMYDHTKHATSVLATPARKLFRLHCRDGR